MNELDLIKEVEKRPILYDKSVTGFKKTKLRDKAWREVQDVLKSSGSHATETECKKRWRSLRDSYIKLLRTRGGRTRWPYVTVMKFLKPHVYVPNKPEDTPTISDSETEEDKSQAIQCLPDLGYMGDNAYDNAYDNSPQPSPKRARTESSGDEITNCVCNKSDPDELFLLSCAKTLKRLNSKQNAVARLKIQQVLYECEFGAQGAGELPCVTPVSDYETLQ